MDEFYNLDTEETPTDSYNEKENETKEYHLLDYIGENYKNTHARKLNRLSELAGNYNESKDELNNLHQRYKAFETYIGKRFTDMKSEDLNFLKSNYPEYFDSRPNNIEDYKIKETELQNSKTLANFREVSEKLSTEGSQEGYSAEFEEGLRKQAYNLGLPESSFSKFAEYSLEIQKNVINGIQDAIKQEIESYKEQIPKAFEGQIDVLEQNLGIF